MMRTLSGWRRFLMLVPLLFFLAHFFSVTELHYNPRPVPNKQSKSNHLVLGPAAGQGFSNRLHCHPQGIKALNKTHFSTASTTLVDNIHFVTVFTLYNATHPDDRLSNLVTVGNTSYSKLQRSMAILNIFVNFIQAAMPRSNVIILTDPASDLSIHKNGVTIHPIQGEYSRDKLMLQRIRSYIAFLETRTDKISQNQGHIQHYIFTDSDIAVVDDIGHIFHDYPNFHLALTFRNNKEQPLNSGFIAVRGTPDGIVRCVCCIIWLSFTCVLGWVASLQQKRQRAKTFLQEVLKVYRSRYMKASRMLGDQLALAWVVKSHPSFDPKKFTKAQAFLDDIGGAAVLFLPCAVYNWTPPEGAGQFHGMPLDVKVIHFKGSRKRLMLESWNFFSASSDISDMLCLILRSGRTKYDF